jgi:hypothetical protein
MKDSVHTLQKERVHYKGNMLMRDEMLGLFRIIRSTDVKRMVHAVLG